MTAIKEIQVRGEYITLAQLLKVVGEVQSGGEVKQYLTEAVPLVNGEPEQRRKRKLHPGDVVILPGSGEIHLIG